MINTVYVVTGSIRGKICSRIVIAEDTGEAISKAKKLFSMVRPKAQKLPIKKGN